MDTEEFHVRMPKYTLYFQMRISQNTEFEYRSNILNQFRKGPSRE